MSESKISFLNIIFTPNFKMILPYLYILNISIFIPFIYELFATNDINKLILLENILLKKPYFCYFIVIFFLLIYYSLLTFIIENILGIDLSYKYQYHEKLFSKPELIYSSPISFFILIYLSEELDLTNPIVTISKSNNNALKYIIISKGIYLILKITEIITIRHTAYYVSLITYDEKESWLIAILKRKIHLGLISRLFLFYKFSIICIYAKRSSFFCYLYISLMLIFIGFKCVKDYRIYEVQKDFYRCLMGNPDNEEKKNCLCKICGTKLVKGIKLQCGHSVHLVCIAQLYKKNNLNCPICGKKISIYQSPLLKYNSNERINNTSYIIHLPFLFTFEIEVNFDDDIC